MPEEDCNDHKLLLAAALAAIPLTAAAQTRRPPSSRPSRSSPRARRSMILSGGNLAAMKAAAEAGGDVKQLVPVRAQPGALGAGPCRPCSRPAATCATSHAKPEVWTRPGRLRGGARPPMPTRPGCSPRRRKRATAPPSSPRWTEVRGTCGACHDAYKSD